MTPDDVRDIFDGLVRARRDLDHLRLRMAALSSPVLSSGITQTVAGATGDPTATAGSALADGDSALRAAEDAYREKRQRAEDICRGVMLGLGQVYGDVLMDYYVMDCSWETVSRLNGIGKATALRYRDVAFDWVASVGIARAKVGEQGPIDAGGA